ncbi:MOSC domain-containing protein [soil metagenome]
MATSDDGGPRVTSVAASPDHSMAKAVRDEIELVAGLGAAGDAHAGTTVQHRSRFARDPSQPNLRQVHLIGAELHDRLAAEGYPVDPGAMGENVTTRGLDLLALATGTHLGVGPRAVVEVTGLRNPCRQLDGIHPGLLAAVLDRDEGGGLIRLAGVMAVVHSGGLVRPGDPITVTPPTGGRVALAPV